MTCVWSGSDQRKHHLFLVRATATRTAHSLISIAFRTSAIYHKHIRPLSVECIATQSIEHNRKCFASAYPMDHGFGLRLDGARASPIK